MFGPSHTPMGQGRVSELLENLNNEFETIARDVNMYKLQRDDYERKIQAQVTELSSIKSTLYDLERKHSKLVRQYEDEIIRLQATSERGNSYPIMEMRRGNAEQEKHTLPSLIPQRSESSTFNFPSGGGLAPINSMAAPGGPPGPSSNLGKRPRPDDKFFSRRDDSQQLPSIQSPKMRKPNEDDSDSGSMMSAHNTLPTMNGNRSSYTNTNNNYKVPPINMGNSAGGGGGGGASQGSGSSSSNTLNAIPTHSEAYREAESARLRSPPTNNSNHSPVPPPSTTPGASVSPATTTTTTTTSSTSNMTTSAGSSAPTTGSRDGTGSSSLSASGSSSGAAIPTASGTTPLTTSNGSATTVTSSTGGRDKVIKQDPQATSSPARAESPSYKMAIDSSAEDAEFRSQPSCVDNLKINLAYELEHTSVVCCVRFSNDGKYLATGCNRKAQIFSVESGERVQTFSDPAWKENDLYLRSVCFSPDGKYLACGAEDKTVKLWDIERQTTSYTFTGHTMDIYSLDYSSDGRFIMSGSGDKKAKIWDVEKRKCAFTLGNDEVGPKDGVTSVSISPDGRLVAAGSLDRIVRLWDAQTGYFLERYEGHSDSVYSVAFSPDGRSLASGSLDKTLKIWDLSESRSRSRCRTFTGHTDFVLSVAFSPDGNWLISGSKDRTVKFWDPRSAVNHAKLEGHKNSVISVAVNPAKGTFATGSGDFRAKVWRYSAL